MTFAAADTLQYRWGSINTSSEWELCTHSETPH